MEPCTPQRGAGSSIPRMRRMTHRKASTATPGVGAATSSDSANERGATAHAATFMGDSDENGNDERQAKRPKRDEPKGGLVLLRKLWPQWADAFASGHKLVEFVGYAKGHGNAMKRFAAGTVMIVSGSGTTMLDAVGVAAGEAVVRLQAADITAALGLIPASMHAGVREYLAEKVSFDYVLFDRCFDLRPHAVQLSDFYARFGIITPRCFSGFQTLENGVQTLAESVVAWCVALGAVQHWRSVSHEWSSENEGAAMAGEDNQARGIHEGPWGQDMLQSHMLSEQGCDLS